MNSHGTPTDGRQCPTVLLPRVGAPGSPPPHAHCVPQPRGLTAYRPPNPGPRSLSPSKGGGSLSCPRIRGGLPVELPGRVPMVIGHVSPFSLSSGHGLQVNCCLPSHMHIIKDSHLSEEGRCPFPGSMMFLMVRVRAGEWPAAPGGPAPVLYFFLLVTVPRHFSPPPFQAGNTCTTTHSHSPEPNTGQSQPLQGSRPQNSPINPLGQASHLTPLPPCHGRANRQPGSPAPHAVALAGCLTDRYS